MQTTDGISLRTDRAPELFVFPSFDRRKIEGSFTGGDVSSDGGLMALRAADKKLGLIAALDAVIKDPREVNQVVHRQRDLLSQRIYGLALGYEDLNDHDTLRKDLLWQSAVEGGRNRPAVRPCAVWSNALTGRPLGLCRRCWWSY